MIENTISIDDCENFFEKDADVMSAGESVETTQTAKEENEFLQGERSDDFSDFTQEEICNEGEAQEENTIPDEYLTLNVYGEAVTVSKAEAIAAAQRGFAFDAIKEKFAEVKNDARLKMLEELSQLSGQSVPDMLCEMQNNYLLNSLKTQYGSVEEVPGEVLAQAVRNLENARTNLQQAGEAMARAEKSAQLREFMENYPDCKDIPDSVIEQARDGKNLSLAYSQYHAQQLAKELRELKQELDILKANKKAKSKSMPSMQGNGYTKAEQSMYGMMKSLW